MISLNRKEEWERGREEEVKEAGRERGGVGGCAGSPCTCDCLISGVCVKHTISNQNCTSPNSVVCHLLSITVL